MKLILALLVIRLTVSFAKKHPSPPPPPPPPVSETRIPDSSTIQRDLDDHGCCISCGEFYCPSQEKCMTDWGKCEFGLANPEDCTYRYTAGSFTYDLHSLIATDPKKPYYKISDFYTHKNQEFDYYFNFCKAVTKDAPGLPEVCKGTTIGTIPGERCDQDAMAYQHFYTSWNYSSCYRLSSCYTTDGPIVELGLLDPAKPASGVYVQYNGGNSCPNSYSDKEACSVVPDDSKPDNVFCGRSFRLNVHCHNEIQEIPLEEEVSEYAGCTYVANINHVAGCPLECPRSSDGSVCSARGMCYYNGYDAGKTVDGQDATLECLCVKGFLGDACEQMGVVAAYNTVKDDVLNYGPFGIPISWFSFFVVLLLVFICYLLGSVFWESVSLKLAGCYYFLLAAWTDSWSTTFKYTPLPSEDDADLNRVKEQGMKYFYGNSVPDNSSENL